MPGSREGAGSTCHKTRQPGPQALPSPAPLFLRSWWSPSPRSADQGREPLPGHFRGFSGLRFCTPLPRACPFGGRVSYPSPTWLCTRTQTAPEANRQSQASSHAAQLRSGPRTCARTRSPETRHSPRPPAPWLLLRTPLARSCGLTTSLPFVRRCRHPPKACIPSSVL